jgi:hypothetical protein
MSSQIAMFKLDAIRKSLVLNRFNEKKTKNLKTIGKLIYDAVVKSIPKPVMTMFTKEEEAFINYDPSSHSFRGEPKYFRATTYISWWSSHEILNLVASMMRNEGVSPGATTVSNVHIDLPYPLPVGEKHINRVVLEEIKKGGKLYKEIREYILRDKEIRTLDNKIKCLFSSKRFYPGTLKNDFPEAYEVYVKMFEGKQAEEKSKPEPTTCDSIESIRATLLSKK